MNWKELEPKITSLQDGLMEIMSQIERLASEEQKLPLIESNFEVSKAILGNRDYDVVVCGEVKKGKSSFINAIVGNDILPVDSDIATSQVFRLSNSADGTEHFKLVFTDGSSRQINRDELSKYGSQVDANLNGSPELGGKNLDYIQVEIPAAFLPQGVNIVDTPGLGALYKSHEAITQNYVRKAAAVVFILDYAKPIDAQEKLFINKVLDVTPYILFVITKSDRYDKNTRNTIISRNEEILKDIFEARQLKVPHIYPISSKLLQDASNDDDADERAESLDESGYKIVEVQLMRLIFRAVGLLRTDNALTTSVSHVNNTRKLIEDYIKACIADEQQILQHVESEKHRLQQEFQNENGTVSKKYKEILQEVTDICRSASNRVAQIFSPNGEVYKSAVKAINEINSTDEANALCESLPHAITNEVESQWSAISDDIREQVVCALNDVNVTIDNVYSRGLSNSYSITPPPMGKSEKLGVVQRGFFGMGMGSSLGAAIGGAVGVIFGPAGIAIGAKVGATIGGAVGAFSLGSNANNDVQKNALKNQLNNMMTSMRSDLLDVHGGRFSKVGEFSDRLLKVSQNALEETILSRKERIQAELEEIQRQGQLDADAKHQEEQKWNKIKVDWDIVADDLKKLLSARKELISLLN